MDNRALKTLRSAFSNTSGKPIAWRNSVAVFLGIMLGGLLGVLLDNLIGGQTFLLSGTAGMFLGLICASGPFVMSLRMVLGIGTLMTLTCGLGAVGAGNAWVAVFGMVLVVFITTLWHAIPFVGVPLGTFPIILYLLVLASTTQFTADAVAWRVMLAVLPSILAAVIILFIFSGWDPRKTTRRMAADAWGEQVSWQQLGSIMAILHLDGAPLRLIAVTQGGVLAMISRGWLSSRKQDAAYTAGTKGDAAVAAALLPRGPVSPRDVGQPATAAITVLTEVDKDSQTSIRYAWDRWRAALSYAVGVLSGTRTPHKAMVSNWSLARLLVGSVMHPDSATFRYGVQRAVALGLTTFIMIQSGWQNFYWTVLTLIIVMQNNVVATQAKSLKYAIGTWIGAVAAVLLGLILPQPVVAVVAVLTIVMGFAWLARNYVVMCIAVAAAVVLLTGAPQGEYLQWAALRAVDVSLAVIIAVAVSAVVLRVRPEPAEHLKQAKSALLVALNELRTQLFRPTQDVAPVLMAENAYLRAWGNLNSDLTLMKDPGPTSHNIEQLQEANNHIVALGSVVVGATEPILDLEPEQFQAQVTRNLDQLDSEIRAIGSDAPATT